MSKYITVTGILIILLAMVTITPAEKETEIYIPLGQSPGLSGNYSAIGRIEQVNYQKNTLTMFNERQASRTLATSTFPRVLGRGTFAYVLESRRHQVSRSCLRSSRDFRTKEYEYLPAWVAFSTVA